VETGEWYISFPFALSLRYRWNKLKKLSISILKLYGKKARISIMRKKKKKKNKEKKMLIRGKVFTSLTFAGAVSTSFFNSFRIVVAARLLLVLS
jgi:hypothetical protein